MELKQLPQRPAAQRAACRASRSPIPLASAVHHANEGTSNGSGMAEASPQAGDAADDDEVLLVGGSSDEVGARTVPPALPCCEPQAPTELDAGICSPDKEVSATSSHNAAGGCSSDEVGSCISVSYGVFAHLIVPLGRWSSVQGSCPCIALLLPGSGS